MKSRAYVLAAVAAGSLIATVHSATGGTSRTTKGAATEAAVKAVIDDFFDLARKRDWDGVAGLLADDFEIYTDGAASFGKQAYTDLLKQDDLETQHMELKDLVLRLSPDGQMAWSKYRGVFVTVSHGQRAEVETAETLVFQNGPGGWKIVRAHASIKATGAEGSGGAQGSQ